MARIRDPKSKLTYGGLGLSAEEDKKLIDLLDKRCITLAKLKRKLIRAWIEQQTDHKSGKNHLNFTS